MQRARRTLVLILWIPLAGICAPQERDLSATQLTAAPGVEGKILAFDASGRIFGASSIAPPIGQGFSAAAFAPDGRVWAASAAFIGRLNATGTAWDWIIDQKVDEINGIAADAKGAVYEVGRLGGDVWIAKFDASGPSPVLAWQKTFGGAGNEAGNAVATDGRTGVYLTGWSDSQDWGAPGRAAGRHGFVLKLDAADGSPQYLNWLAEGAEGEGLGIAVMPDLSVVVTGRTGLGNFPSTNGFAGDTCEPNSAFLTRVSPAGDSLVYSGCLSGDGQQEGRTLALDTQGNVWVAGSTTSPRFAGEESLPGIRRAWIAWLSADGSAIEFVKGMAAMGQARMDTGVAIVAIVADPSGDGAFAAGSAGEGVEQKPLLLRVGPSTSSAGTMQVHASNNTSGNSAYAVATASTQTSPGLLSQTITFDAIPNRIFGISPFPIAAQSNALLPVGFKVTTPAVCRISDDLVMLLSAGTCSITASQPGNAIYSAATSVMQSFTVTRAKASSTFAQVTGSPFQVGTEPTSVVVGYFNGDSVPDLATANDGSGNVSVLLGTGTGMFAPAVNSPFTTGTTPHTLTVGDFNGDGDQDLVTANETVDSVTVLLANASGGFAPAGTSPFAASPVGVVVGDFNGDGIQDLATASLGGNISVLLGNGSGGFTGSDLTAGTNPFAVVVGDFNGDGLQDLAAANLLDNTVTVLLGNGLGGFTPAAGSPFMTGNYPYALAVGDFNRDGIQDLAISNFMDDTVTVLLGDILGGFVPALGSPFAVGTSPSSVVVADFNGDGIPDLATANYRSNNVTVLLGNGLGGFAPAPGSPFMVGTSPQSVAVADFNGDGIEDLAVANNGGNNVTVLLGSVGVSQTITFGPLSSVSYGAPPFTVSATSSSGLAVSFASTTPTVCTAAGTTVTIVGGGTCSIVASQAGNATYAAAATVTQSFTVPASQTITFGVLINQILGVATAHAANLSWTASATPNVTYNVYRAAASTGPYTTRLNSSPITGTTYTDTSVQGGQTYYYVTTAVASNGTQSADSNAVQVTIPSLLPASATASSGLGVTFVSNNLSVCTISGATITVVSAGICSITASQPGNSNWAVATPVTRTFTVYPPLSLSPNAGAGTSVRFQAVYSDPNGAGDVSELQLLVNSSVNAANGCYVYYQPQGNHLYLANSAGSWITPPLTPGVAGTAANSQCTLNAGSSAVSTAGNSLTLNVALSFSGTVAGSPNVYLYARGLSGQNTGWVKEGTWTPNPIAEPPGIVSLSPNVGAGPSVTFQAVYSDPNGAGDVSEALLLVNGSVNGANACYVYYQPLGNHLYLANNAGTAWMTPALTPGAAGTASNSQCTLNAGSSSVSTSGNNLTLNVALSFRGAVSGSPNVYLYALGFSGQNSGWVKQSTWTPNPIAQPPAIVSLSPNAGAGTSVTFQAVYSDPNGAGDLSEALLLVNGSVNSANGCYVYYQPLGNHLYLANNAGTAWMTPALTPGIAGTASNSQCTLSAGSSSVSTSGNNLTLNVALSFSGAVAGSPNVYLYAIGFSGLNSGWVKEGTWTPNPTAGPPAIVSLSPNAGAGTSVTFQAVYFDPNGAGDVSEALLLVNGSVNSANGCYVYYQPLGNHLYLANNAGSWITPALTPGVAGTASNSQCTLNAGSSSVSTSGNNLTLNVTLSFSGTVAGSPNVYLYALGFSGLNSGWVKEGTWTPNPTAGPPAIVSLSPNAGAGTSVTFQAVYSDPNGAGDVSEAMLLVNGSVNAANACYVYYQPQGNHLYLSNNAGSWITPALTPGVAGTAANGQCTLNAGSSSVSTSGNNLTLNVALSFSGTVAGSPNVYLYALGFSGLNSGWVKEGTWTPNPTAGPPAIVSLSPNAGAGTSVTFQAVYSDPNGAGDVSEAMLLVNGSVNAANACYVYYQPLGNHLYLANNAGTAWMTPALTPGMAGTVSNSQCTLNAGSSSVSTSGNSLTLNVALSFSGTVAGSPNVYLYALGFSGQNSGWVKEGTWTP